MKQSLSNLSKEGRAALIRLKDKKNWDKVPEFSVEQAVVDKEIVDALNRGVTLDNPTH